MVDAALRSPLVDGLSYPRVHPLQVLNLAREVGISVILPSVVYFLSLSVLHSNTPPTILIGSRYPLDDLLRADHPKLMVEHPSRPSSVLSPLDMKDYTLMFQKRLDIILNFVRSFCGTRTALPTCRTGPACTSGFARLSSRLSRSWITRTGPRTSHFFHHRYFRALIQFVQCTTCPKQSRIYQTTPRLLCAACVVAPLPKTSFP
jgi:hypothetical protein